MKQGTGQITKAYGFNPNAHDAEEELWSTDAVWQADIHNGSLTSSQTRYHYITTDHLGTPILATDKSGNKTWRGYSEAFGHTATESTAGAQINLRFPGQYWDKETGLHQNYFRDYSPARGRYIQSDPIGLWGGINTYGYAYNDPLGYMDSTGEFALPGAIVGGLINFGWQFWKTGGRIDCINWGSVASWAAIGSGVGGIIRSGANLGFWAELGRWGPRGSWTNNKRYRVPHFHLGHKKNGLGTHHLPFQGVKWIKNFKNLYKEGKSDV